MEVEKLEIWNVYIFCGFCNDATFLQFQVIIVINISNISKDKCVYKLRIWKKVSREAASGCARSHRAATLKVQKLDASYLFSA